jgi:hypothetical protein
MWLVVGAAVACGRSSSSRERPEAQYVPATSYPGTVASPIVALAPTWVKDETSLGILFDDSFRPLPDSRVVVTPHTYASPSVVNTCVAFQSWQSFRATLSAGFNIGPLGVGVDVSDTEYEASSSQFRQCMFFEHDEVDLSTPPTGARYMLAKIELGYSNDYIVEGTRTDQSSEMDFTASTNAEFAQIQSGTNSSSSTLSRHWYQQLRGMRPRVGAGVLAGSAIGTAYEHAETSFPVLVEYRELCGGGGCITPGRYRIDKLPVKIGPRDLDGKRWDDDGSDPDLVFSLYVDDAYIGTCHRDNLPVGETYDCASELKSVSLDLRDKPRVSFLAIDDDAGDDMTCATGCDVRSYADRVQNDPVGGGQLDLVVGNRANAPLVFHTTGHVSASITLVPEKVLR